VGFALDLGGHGHVLFDVHFSPEGPQILTASFDHTARTRDVAVDPQLPLLRCAGSTRGLCWRRDTLVATCEPGVARTWDLRPPAERWLRLHADRRYRARTWTPGKTAGRRSVLPGAALTALHVEAPPGEACLARNHHSRGSLP
jgi:WD40 repeat protein